MAPEPAASGLAGHPDRLRWNARYRGNFVPSFRPHPLAERALALGLPAGPVLDLACGPSGSALLLAADLASYVTSAAATPRPTHRGAASSPAVWPPGVIHSVIVTSLTGCPVTRLTVR
jgi:hypothetical protein